MAQRLSGEPNNSKFDSSRPEKEITTTTKSDKTYLDTNSILTNSNQNDIGSYYNPQEDQYELSVATNGHVCVDNSTSELLGGDEVFLGDWQDTLNYNTITIGISTNVSSATDGLMIEWSSDMSVVDDRDVFSIITNKNKTFTFSPARKYFRVNYTNGSTPQSYFNIQTVLRRGGFKPSSHRINDTIVTEDDAELVKAVLTAKRDDNNDFVNIEGDKFKRLHVQDNTAVTAFGDIRTAEITPILQMTFDYTVDNSEITTNTITGSGSVTEANAMAHISTGTTTNSIGELCSKTGAKYRAGLGGLFRTTAKFTTGVSGTSQWAGIVDGNGVSADFTNGFAIGYNGDTFGVTRFQNDVMFFTPLSECDDPLDGTGLSEMTLDPTKLNVFFIQFQYLGAGAINFFVEDDKNGEVFVFHTINYTNQNDTPHVHNSNFFIRFKADNKDTTEDLTINTASCAYFTEGKTKYYELQQPQFSTGTRQKATVTTETALFTIRNKATYSSKVNFVNIAMERLFIGVLSGNPNSIGQWRLVKDATIGGTPSYTSINSTNSVIEIDVAGTTITGGKNILAGALFADSDRTTEDLTAFDITLSPGETLTLAVQNTVSATFIGSLLWKELF